MELCQIEYSFVNVCTLTFRIIWLVLKLNIHRFGRIMWFDTALTAEDSCYVKGSTVSHWRAASSCHAHISSGSYTRSANVALKSTFYSIFVPPIIFWQIAVHTYYTHAETMVRTHARSVLLKGTLTIRNNFDKAKSLAWTQQCLQNSKAVSSA